MASRFQENLRNKPFADYSEYMDYIFATVNLKLRDYIAGLMEKYDQGGGNYKNIMYPDIEIAYETASKNIDRFNNSSDSDSDLMSNAEGSEEEEDLLAGVDDDLANLLDAFSGEGDFFGSGDDDEDSGEAASGASKGAGDMSIEDMFSFIDERIAITDTSDGSYKFYKLVKKLEFGHFAQFALAAAMLSSTQTSYGSVFQIVNENGSFTSPTVESAAHMYFGKDYSITKGYSEMSVCLEKLLPIMDLRVNPGMPFSTVLAPDKRLIDFLFGGNPLKIDDNYSRFIKLLTSTKAKPLDPIMANKTPLEAMNISYDQGVRIFSWFGDEGSGRKFFIKHFCHDHDMHAITINCKKLFVYDFSFVEKALWAASRECIFTDACIALEQIEFREEEKEKYIGYMDLAVSKLRQYDILIFFISKEKLPLKQVTTDDFTELELGTPTNEERNKCWEYYSKDYALAEDVDLFEMSTKFLFTPGKIAGALYQARSYATMDHEANITRAKLFKGCNNQMSSELSQKATRVEAKFGFDDIVMNKDQRETIGHAIEQMMFKKQVYDDWDYTKKYPYGRGLTVLLFGAPGTGKSMMAQVLAHELNLELYRVDISKVVDKYVGETEKSLSMIFREAKKCNVVLFFDECDTIFAKRSDDGGSNQASANNKTALLLQEMEAYDGVCVLATNYKHNIDPAFFRRMKYIVEFQFPNADTREMLWRTTVPKTTPLDEDVDFRFIAEKFEFAGGNIKNCILNAAFLAAADETANGKVCMRHYLNAIKFEFVKTGAVFTKADFEPYAYMVGLADEDDYDF